MTLGDPVDQTFFFEMEDGYQKIVRIDSGATQTSFHVQICDHMAAIQREYDVNVPTGEIASVRKNDMYVVATVRVKGLLRSTKELYV